jgi:hypothetical protein
MDLASKTVVFCSEAVDSQLGITYPGFLKDVLFKATKRASHIDSTHVFYPPVWRRRLSEIAGRASTPRNSVDVVINGQKCAVLGRCPDLIRYMDRGSPLLESTLSQQNAVAFGRLTLFSPDVV